MTCHHIKILILDHPRIQSEKRFNDIANTPLWSCLLSGYAASSLEKAGFNVVMLDARKCCWDFERTKRELLLLNPDLVCVNAVYLWEHTSVLLTFLDDLKLSGYRGYLTLFGFFPSLSYHEILDETQSVDSVVVGECELTLIELAGSLEQGKSTAGIAGLAVRKAGRAFLGDHRRPEQFPDIFPWPKRDLYPNDTVSILASRGCYNHCKFCPIPSFYSCEKLWFGRNPEKIYQEIEHYVNQGFKDFYFTDPNFIGPGKKGKERINRLMQLIKPLNITFGMETRPNDLNTEVLEEMVSAGLTSLLLGIESGSTEVLHSIGKSSSLKASKRAISLCRKAGVEPEVGFLMFVPDSTLEDLYNNFEFLNQCQLLDRLDRTVNLLSHSQIVLKGTTGYTDFKQQNRLTPSGALGFEGEVVYKDPKVKWMADVITFICHLVLREMAKPHSSIFWKENSFSSEKAVINDYLIRKFQQLSDEVASQSELRPIDQTQESLMTDFTFIIGR